MLGDLEPSSSRGPSARHAVAACERRRGSAQRPGCAPQRHPAAEVRLHRQLAGELVADLDLEQVVAAAAAPLRGERVERALLVEVDQPDPAARRRRRTATSEHSRPGPKPWASSEVLTACRSVHSADSVVGVLVGDQPGEAELVAC